MRASTRRKASALCALALLSTLVACATPAPPPEPSPTATTAAPVFATDAEALAAATEAYAAYVSVSDLIFAEGGVRPERIDEVASGTLAASVRDESAYAVGAGLRSTGANTFDSISLQSVDEAASRGVVIIYLCSDVSATDVLDSNGVSVVKADRPPRTPFQVSFDWKDSTHRELVVGSQNVWTGGGVC